jgi:hypothetical protein
MEIGTIVDVICKEKGELGWYVEFDYDGKVMEGFISHGKKRKFSNGKKIRAVLIRTSPDNQYNDFKFVSL